MAPSNFERMLQLAEDVFATKTDPGQLDVDEEILAHLRELHPATVSEENEGDGPIAWVLLIPTTTSLMNQFLNKEISERELYDRTPLNANYEAVYLCSGMVLEEHRRKGIAKRLTLDAIAAIRKDHPVAALFVWSFSEEGDHAAEVVAHAAGLPLYKRPE